MPDQKNQPNRTNEDPQDSNRNEQDQNNARNESTDKNRVGGDAARTEAKRPQDQGNTRPQKSGDKTDRP